MESDAVVRMAREDTRWFAVAVVVLALVLFLALPLTALMYIEVATVKAQVRAEIRDLRKLKSEVERKQEDVANRRGDRIEPDQ